MPLHIKDEAAAEAVRRLARVRNLSLTETVRIACEEALERDDRARPIAERLADIHALVRAAPRTGRKADKAFFDREWGEEE
jgi:antitoxin VapB